MTGAGSARRLVIDRTVCAGHGRCYSLTPDLVGVDEAGYPIVLDEEIPDDLVDAADETVGSCPEGAIRVSPLD